MGLFDSLKNTIQKTIYNPEMINPWADSSFYGQDSKNLIRGLTSNLLESVWLLPATRDLTDWADISSRQPHLYGIITRIADSLAETRWEIFAPSKKATKKKYISNNNFARNNLTCREFVPQYYNHQENKMLDYEIRSPFSSNRDGRVGEDRIKWTGCGNYRMLGSTVANHPLIQIMSHPNPVHTGIQVQKFIQMNLDVMGEAYLVIERDQNGEPAQLWPVPTFYIERVASMQRPYYLCRVLGVAYYVPVEDIVQFRSLDLSNPYWRGRGPAQAANDEIAALEYSEKWNSRRFLNSCRPEIALIIDGNVANEEEANLIREKFDGAHSGFLNSFKTMVVGGRIKEIREMGLKAFDMDFPKLIESSLSSLLAAYGMPASMIGMTKDVNRGNAETSLLLYTTHIILPRLIAFQNTITMQLLPQYKKFKNCWMEFESPIPEDRETEINNAKVAYMGGAITKNEYRDILGIPPAIDGDVYIIPLANMAVPLGQGNTLPAPAPTITGPAGSGVGKPEKPLDADSQISDITTDEDSDQESSKDPNQLTNNKPKLPKNLPDQTTAPDGEMPDPNNLKPKKPKKDSTISPPVKEYDQDLFDELSFEIENSMAQFRQTMSFQEFIDKADQSEVNSHQLDLRSQFGTAEY